MNSAELLLEEELNDVEEAMKESLATVHAHHAAMLKLKGADPKWRELKDEHGKQCTIYAKCRVRRDEILREME